MRNEVLEFKLKLAQDIFEEMNELRRQAIHAGSRIPKERNEVMLRDPENAYFIAMEGGLQKGMDALRQIIYKQGLNEGEVAQLRFTCGTCKRETKTIEGHCTYCSAKAAGDICTICDRPGMNGLCIPCMNELYPDED